MADVQWVVIVYLLAITSLIVGAGRLGDLVGRRRLLLAGMGLFSAASAICALSPGLCVVSALGFAAFVRTETRAPAPLVRLDLLRDRTLGTGLASLMLVSAIVMATLVVGPFYLSGVLGLDPVETGMVMSVGPAVAALTGVPAGRLVDRLGSFPVIVAGLLAVMIGSLLLTLMPVLFGAGGYVVMVGD